MLGRSLKYTATSITRSYARATLPKSRLNSARTMSAATHPVATANEPAPVQKPAQDNKAGSSKPVKEKKLKDKVKAPQVSLEVTPPPEFFATRNAMFDQYMADYKKWLAEQPRDEITITLPNGDTKKGEAWETTPMSIAKSIAVSLADKVIISKVDNVLWDLNRPLEKSCTLSLLDFDSPENNYEARQVFWHSSAHVMGEACERHLDNCCLGYGPPLEEGGFFYDMGLPVGRTISQADYPNIEAVAKIAVKEKQPFERLELPKAKLMEMFAYNQYKQHYIDTKVPDNTSTTVYRCGPLIDLCLGPHVPHTGRIKALAITKNSSSYFLGDAKNDTLQRIYGISFPDAKQMTEHKKYMEEAAKRDHRKIGREQELWMFNDISPGSAFFLPMGMRIYNTLINYIKSEYHTRGFQEVQSPNMYNSSLWKTSGHWENYSEDMFKLESEKEVFALKPMNCPGHCLIFDSRERSYKELPIRMAEFGVLHRNEASGALSGLTRVRRFVQDDAHIFCTLDQVEEEILSAFDFLNSVYGIFGFTYKVGLSTRNPSKFIGDLAVWDRAEKQLSNVLDKVSPNGWHINEHDAAFYGPKLDITLEDAMKRKFQCATIQLDFNLPERFKLRYRTAEGKEEGNNFSPPVMIHRAVLGSLERFLGIITESCGGKWPFWLSPRQVVVIPVAATYKDYATKVQQKFWDAGIFAETDVTDNTLGKKIRNAQIAQWNFIMVVGEAEMNDEAVNIRNRDDEVQGREETVKVDVALAKLLALKNSRAKVNKLD